MFALSTTTILRRSRKSRSTFSPVYYTMNRTSGHSGEPGDIGYNGFLISLFYLARIDIECITDANLTVIFKNLVKKNAVTREKRLADLLNLVQNDKIDFRDDTFIMVWLQLYPRVALDSSKTVRQTAHQIQATLLEKVGGREFSKYLKSSIPVMLQSLYDDKSIANGTHATLMQSFNNDSDRVNVKLWEVFHEQITNYCRAVIVNETASSITDERYETQDDVLLKYDRAVNGAIQMLVKLINMANKGQFFLSERAMRDFDEILAHEAFWDALLSCTSGSSINVQLTKSYMQLLKAVFALDDSNNLLPFTEHLSDIRSLYKAVSKKFIKCVKFLVPHPESPNSTIIYLSTILQFWDTLSALTLFTNLDAATQKALKIKKNFWQIGGSKSYSRLRDYLKLGSCLSDPVYYLIVKSFFIGLKAQRIASDDDFSFLSFSSSKDAKSIIEKIFLPKFSQIRGLNAALYKKNAADCICSVLELFDIKQSSYEPLLKQILVVLLDGFAVTVRANEQRVQDESINQLAKFASTQELGQEVYVTNFVELVGIRPFTVDSYVFNCSIGNIFTTFAKFVSLLPENLSYTLLSELLDRLQELYEPDEVTDAFTALVATLKIVPASCALLDFAPTLPGFVSPDFTDLPLQVLESLVSKKTELNLSELVEDFFTKLSTDAPSRLKDLFVILNRHNALDVKSLETSNPGIHQYLVSLSKKNDRSKEEDEIVFVYLNSSEMVSNVLSSSLTDETSQKRLIEKLADSQLPVEPSSELETLISTSLKNISAKLSQQFLSLIMDKDLVAGSIFKFVIQSTHTSDFEALSKFLYSNADLFPSLAISTELQTSLASMDLSMVSLANPLVQNIHLVEFPSPSECEANENVLSIGKFLLDYKGVAADVSSEIFISLGLCGQYCQDYSFVLDVDKSKSTILNLEHQLTFTFSEHHPTTNIITSLINGSLDEGAGLIYALLQANVAGKGPYTPFQFYNARLLVLLFTKVFESMSLGEFENLEIQYTRLVNTPLILAIFLCSAVKFIGVSKKLDRIRNYVFGEVLGVKLHQIMESGTTWITLATNFVRVDPESVSGYEVLPIHKWGMFMNSINSWLESDIAYDNEFLPMRCLLAVFFSYLVPVVASNLPDKAWEVAVDLCLNNLSTAQVESQDLELKYFSMKLFIVLCKHVNEDVFVLWNESKASIVEELVDLMINKEIEIHNMRLNNQPVLLSNELFERILIKTTLPKSFVGHKVDKFYDLLSTSKFLNLQRVATSYLNKYIVESQQDFVIEYLLQKTKLGDSDDNLAQSINLPPLLLSNIHDGVKFETALEEEDFSTAARYLWSWLLIFDHFKDTTYSIKAEYINQLKAEGTIDILLHVIFNSVDVSDTNFLKKLVVTPLAKLAKATPDNCLIQEILVKDGCIGETTSFEMRFLLVHLYYLSFQYLGSFVQQWFNEIRDLQLKNQVEKFSLRYVSPILISKMLEEVDSQKNKLVERDENLTIKVNRVINEIKSVYVIDEQTMEMVVKIPETFPLSNVSVEGPVRLGVKENQWKAWLLASQRVISLTNGSIFDCVELFNKNVNLHFSGFEECAICYSILHQDHSLPSKVCPTCLNKFHAACLYKWFKSSGSSTCPLCRCAFNFKTSRA